MEHSEKDPMWRDAERRTAFKRNLATYVVFNLFFVGIWYFSGNGYGTGHFWPIWPMLGWGVGLVMHYLGAYHTNTPFSVEKEYEKLKKEKENR